jgi:hypothetical protein
MIFMLNFMSILTLFEKLHGVRGSVVIEALCYKLEGRWFETWWGKWILSIYLILPASLYPGVYSASNRTEYHKQIK